MEETLHVAPSLHKSEQAQADGRIKLKQLRKLADRLERELAYALVPRTPLSKVVEERARSIAMQDVGGVAHNMSLEGQRPVTDRLLKQVEQRAVELLRGRWSELWR